MPPPGAAAPPPPGPTLKIKIPEGAKTGDKIKVQQRES
jgi:hypothetical protein